MGYEPNSSNIASTFFDLQNLYDLMGTQGVFFSGTVLEIGSGWFPIAGIIARLAGAERVILTDITPFMDQQTFLTAKQIVLQHLDELGASFNFDARCVRDKLIEARTPEELGLAYEAPFDIAAVPDSSIDLVMSRACLEHIPVADLEVLLVQLKPKLKSHGFMAHAIDNSDHFAHFDDTISRVNFLTWNEAKHRLIWKLAKGGENRLRHHEYAILFERAGYAVAGANAFIDTKLLDSVQSLTISARYRHMTPQQLAAISSWYVLKIKASDELAASAQRSQPEGPQ